ncbi:MAG: ABC transporter permease [Deltaproteobacteria bacterium]|nr:ABC transporter permease [Deltaproteobacteria bacterium]
MRSLLTNLRFSFRLLLKSPTTTGLAILALALGLGLTAAMYSLIYTLSIKDLPFEDGHRLLHLERSNPSRGIHSMEVTQHDFVDWRAQQQSFEDLVAFRTTAFNLSGGERPERYQGGIITPNFLDQLRVQPVLGRDFTNSDAEPGAADVALLSHTLWQTRYGGTEDILAKVIKVNGTPTTVVGILPVGFEFPLREQLWIPLKIDIQEVERGEGRTLEVFGRLAPNRSLEQARAEIATIAKRLDETYPESNEGVTSLIKPYKDEFVGAETQKILWIMLAAVSLVLLIACANVANLLLARASSRAKELAIRSALGASRKAAVFQLLTDSFLIALLGGGLSIFVLGGSITWLNRVMKPLQPPFWYYIEFDGALLFFVFSIALASAIFAGLIPALRATRGNLNETLADSSRGGGSLRMGRLSKALVIGEIAMASALLLCAGLTIRTVVNLQDLDFSFEPERVLTAQLSLSAENYPEEVDYESFYRDLTANLNAHPRVEVAAIGSALPTNRTPRARYALDEETYPDPQDMPLSKFYRVSPGYFTILGIASLEGRLLSEADHADSLPVVVVNRSFAQREWPQESALGHRIRFRGDDELWYTIVGVIPDQYVDQMDPLANTKGVYLPYSHSSSRHMFLALSGSGDTKTLTAILRQEVARLDSDEALAQIYTMQEVIELNTFQNQILGTMFSVFAGAALLLTAIGLYGVMAFAVGQRTQEIGVRMAFGAQRRQVVQMVLRQGLRQTAIGLAFGLVLAYFLARGLVLVLYGVSPGDIGSYVLTALVLTAVALIACAVPARRAAALDPVKALRQS